ncbi:hypothetical protein NI583_003002 [Salmonella enterica]|nr:hypothetical protein [Salmonella enterica]EBE2443231.1 hypothetical protein [Salmonella enterica subsp. enterica serovar Infantis]EGZ4524831.1 hypothetical protein [Salmonella enterica subsp. enterica serovar Abaetetuba]EKR1709232.1 hypothetical protein [Salmonella enterica subsp. enterica serovar Carrau]EBT7963593.1 hypothetical protein [Salmonella enterica]
MTEIFKTLHVQFQRAILATGAIPALGTLFIVGSLVYIRDGIIIYLTLGIFGLLATIEVYYRHGKAVLEARSNIRGPDRIFLEFVNKGFNHKILKEFEYQGFIFRTHGFEEMEVAVTATGPYCPRCKGQLAERRRIKYLFFPEITFRCVCGFCTTSDRTRGEMLQDVRDMMCAIFDEKEKPHIG